MSSVKQVGNLLNHGDVLLIIIMLIINFFGINQAVLDAQGYAEF